MDSPIAGMITSVAMIVVVKFESGKVEGFRGLLSFLHSVSDELLPKCIRHELSLFALVSC